MKLGQVPRLTKFWEDYIFAYIIYAKHSAWNTAVAQHSLPMSMLVFIAEEEFLLWCSMAIPVARLPGFAFWLCCVTVDKLHNLSVAQLHDLKNRDNVTYRAAMKI